jgi:hypothetical protein
MPRKLEAGGTFDYVLKADREQDNPVKFKLNILSSRQDDLLRDLRSQLIKVASEKERVELSTSLAKLVVSGWSNYEKQFSVDEFLDLCTKCETREIIDAAMYEAALTPEERKKLESLRSSDPAKSADDATVASVAAT